MLNKESLNNPEMFLAGWEKGLLEKKSELFWMKEQYEATDEEVELEAILKLFTLVCGNLSLKAEENDDPNLFDRIEVFENFAKTIKKMPASLSLARKFGKNHRERTINGKIS